MIAIIDYGVGNLYSLTCSLNYIGERAVITSDIDVIRASDKIILPGVGAFSDAKAKLDKSGLGDILISEAKSGKPILGICLGMQLLFNSSYEHGITSGLGLIDGDICPISEDLSTCLKVPHIGWNSLSIKRDSKLLKYVNDGDYVYYVHSYYAKNCDSSVVATSNYDIEITGVVENENVFGTQFHPEKSGKVGLNILRAFAEL